MNKELYRVLDTELTRACMTGFQGYVFEKVETNGNYIVLNTFDGNLLFNAEDIEKIDLKKVTYDFNDDMKFKISGKEYIIKYNDIFSVNYNFKITTVDKELRNYITLNCLNNLQF